MKKRWSALVCAALLVPLAFAEPTTLPTTKPTEISSDETAALVKQVLGDDTAAREAATQSLLNAGETALAALQTARTAARDPDAQVRLDTLLVQVKERADVGATKVTLQFEDTPLDEIIQSLGKQARTDFGTQNLVNEFGGQALPRPKLDLHDVSLWRAIREIQESAGVVFIPQGDVWRVSKNFGQMSLVQGEESGAFLVQPMSSNYQRSITYLRNMGDGGERFYLQFQMLCEPKVKLASGAGMVTFERAVDSNGNDLLASQRVSQVSTGMGQSVVICNMPLKYPKNAGAKIAEIRGTMKLSIARRTSQIASDDLAADKRIEKTVDGVKIRIEVNADANVQNGIGFNVAIENVGDLAGAQRLAQNFQQQIHITDARGLPLQMTNFNQVRNDNRGGSEWQATYLSVQPPQSTGPYKLRIEIPTGFRELEVPFAMRDMKMP